MTRLSKTLLELRRRHVFRVTGIYIVGAWVALQVADLAFDSFGLPDEALRFVWFALIAGFPVAVVWGWRYDITPDGIVRTAPSSGEQTADVKLQAPDYIILTALSVIVLFIVGGVVNEIRRLPGSGSHDYAINRNILSSIAVLPLENLSGDPGQAYLSAGMHDALIASLAKIASFRVISRTSAMRLSRELTIPEIGRKLGVDKVVEGSVTREQDEVRIIVQLIDAETDEHIWTENYVRPFDSAMALQNEVATSIASAIQVRLTPEEMRRLDSRDEINPDTLDAYLRAMYKFRRESAKGIRQGIDILTDAVENDPTSALAWAGLAYGYLEIGHSPFPQSIAVPRAKAAADRAIELDADLAQAHLAAGMFSLYYDWNVDDAKSALGKALQLSPSLVEAHYHLAWLHELLGDHDVAIGYGEQTKTLDPLSPFYSGWLASQYRAAGRYEEAIAEAENTLGLRKNYPVAYLVLGETYLELGDTDAAIEAHRQLAGSRLWSFVYGTTLARTGRRDEALELIERLSESEASVPLVLLYAALSDHDAAYEWMLKARDQKAGWYPWLLTWFSQTRAIRDDPRIEALRAEIGL